MTNNNNVKNFSSYRLIDFSTFKKRAAFTLAEVLITLGVIGIIAAMTIPALISANNKRITETRLKRFYSTFNQAIRLSTIDNGEVEGWTEFWDATKRKYGKDGILEDHTDAITSSFDKYLLPYMKVMYKKNVKVNNAVYNLYVLADGSAFSFWSGTGACDINFYPANAEKCLEHSEDNTKNNSICSFGFIFYPISNDAAYKYHYKQGLEPYKFGWDGTREGLYKHCAPGYSAFCTEIIKQNGWKIPADFPKKIRYY